MVITLVRHGAASPGPVDEVRALTDDGRREVMRLGRALMRRGVRFDRVIASPLVRARQTAETIVNCLGLAVPIEEDTRLLPEGAPEAVLDLVRVVEQTGAREVALVAHMPIVGRFAHVLQGGDVPSFRTGQALRIAVRDASAATAGGDWLP